MQGQPDPRCDVHHADASPRRTHRDDLLQRQCLQNHQIAVWCTFDEPKPVMGHRHVLGFWMLRADLDKKIVEKQIIARGTCQSVDYRF